MEKIQRKSRADSFKVCGEPVKLKKFQIIIPYRGVADFWKVYRTPRAATNAVTLARISSKLTVDDIAVQTDERAEPAVAHDFASDCCFRVGAILPLGKNFPSGAGAILRLPHTHRENCGKIEGYV